jgi:hypothetical protein
MPTILEAYLERLEALHAEIQQIIADLSPEALDWTPGPEMNSLGVLVAHVAGSERYWIGTVVGDAPLERDRDAEFRTHGLDGVTLAAQLDPEMIKNIRWPGPYCTLWSIRPYTPGRFSLPTNCGCRADKT